MPILDKTDPGRKPGDRPKGASRGFTLLEAVVALAITGLAGVAALEALSGELRGAEHAREAYTAAALAQHRLAAVALIPARDLSALPDSVARGMFPPPFTGYRWTATVQPAMAERDLYDVTVEITGERAHATVATRLYRPPPLGT